MAIKLEPGSPQAILAELFTKYVRQQAAAHDAGFFNPEDRGDVLPHDAATAQPVDSGLAWNEACTVIDYLAPESNTSSWKVPPDWSNLVAHQGNLTAIPFCLGNFPQEVQDYSSLLQQDGFVLGKPTVTFSISTKLQSWLEKASWKGSHANPLMAGAILRLAGDFDQAEQMLNDHKDTMPDKWRAAWTNEQAALEWQRGRTEEAAALWQKQTASVPVHFNRGLAALVLGHPGRAEKELSQAVSKLPDNGAWHHLGRVYLAMVELRR
ncbi:MAG: tetratricopeptide repeat protein [Gemmataceae bacterium]